MAGKHMGGFFGKLGDVGGKWMDKMAEDHPDKADPRSWDVDPFSNPSSLPHLEKGLRDAAGKGIAAAGKGLRDLTRDVMNKKKE